MKRHVSLLLAGLFVVGSLCGLAQAQEKAAGNSATQIASKLKTDPNNVGLINQLMRSSLTSIMQDINANPKRAGKKIETLRSQLNAIKPTQVNAKEFRQRALLAVKSFERQLEVAQTNTKELIAKLKKNPDDAAALNILQLKLVREVGSNARSNPDKAEESLKKANQIIADIKQATKNDTTKQQLARLESSLKRYESTIAAGRKLKQLVGKPMVAIDNVEAWVNGKPLAAADLKGKVVLLDFWAVWCGPCIATFPHLKELQDKYTGKGLVTVGLTRYYNYTWDDAKKRASKSQGQVSHDEENQMLAQFLKHHKLKHVIALTKDRALAEAYGVTGIPHVVVIDRDGVIRLIRVGSGEKNAQDVEDMIKKLIGDKT